MLFLFILQEGRYQMEKEFPAIGIAPFDPYHNSSFTVAGTYIFTFALSEISPDFATMSQPLRRPVSDQRNFRLTDANQFRIVPV